MAVSPHSSRYPAVGVAGCGAAVLWPSTVNRSRSPGEDVMRGIVRCADRLRRVAATRQVSAGRHRYDGTMTLAQPVLVSLAAIPFFSGLEPDALERLASSMRTRRFRRGEVIFHIGDP